MHQQSSNILGTGSFYWVTSLPWPVDCECINSSHWTAYIVILSFMPSLVEYSSDHKMPNCFSSSDYCYRKILLPTDNNYTGILFDDNHNQKNRSLKVSDLVTASRNPLLIPVTALKQCWLHFCCYIDRIVFLINTFTYTPFTLAQAKVTPHQLWLV